MGAALSRALRHRVAITNSRIVASMRVRHHPLQGTQSSRWRTADYRHEFMRLSAARSSKGLHKVRYFGLWHPPNGPKRSSPIAPQLDQTIPLWPTG